MHICRTHLIGWVVAGAASTATVALAQPVPDYDFAWSTIGSPGNRAANAQEAPAFYVPPPVNPPGGRQVGAVNYEYRLSRTEVTTAQWFEFVQAYTPYYTGQINDPSFTSLWISATDFEPGHDPGYQMSEGAANLAAAVSWRFAARYVNWLSNGKNPAQWAFETGSYDTSTFTQNPDGSFNDQLTHSPNAQFWLPTIDEWVKGMHYSPDRYGLGQEGYWYYPHGSNEPPVPGYPENGGESLAGMPLFSGPYLPVGSYPNVHSPSGLLDGSGGLSEWTEFASPDGSRRNRSIDGTQDFIGGILDRIDRLSGAPADFGLCGVRVASQIPASGTAALFAVPLFAFLRRNRNAEASCGGGGIVDQHLIGECAVRK